MFVSGVGMEENPNVRKWDICFFTTGGEGVIIPYSYHGHYMEST